MEHVNTILDFEEIRHIAIPRDMTDMTFRAVRRQRRV